MMFINWIRYDIPNFFKNIWIFRKELTNYHPWDYNHSLRLLRKSLIESCSYLEFRGHENNETRLKKVYYMKRCIYLLDCIIDDLFSDIAEKSLSLIHSSSGFEFKEIFHDNEKYYEMIDLRNDQEKIDDDKIRIESLRIEREYWEELFNILKGDNFDYDFYTDSTLKGKSYEEIQTGRGLINWWD